MLLKLVGMKWEVEEGKERVEVIVCACVAIHMPTVVRGIQALSFTVCLGFLERDFEGVRERVFEGV